MFSIANLVQKVFAVFHNISSFCMLSSFQFKFTLKLKIFRTSDTPFQLLLSMDTGIANIKSFQQTCKIGIVFFIVFNVIIGSEKKRRAFNSKLYDSNMSKHSNITLFWIRMQETRRVKIVFTKIYLQKCFLDISDNTKLMFSNSKMMQ